MGVRRICRLLERNLPMNRVLRTLKTFATRRLTITFDNVQFTYTCLSYRRIWNWFLAEMSYLFRSAGAWAYPTHLQIEPSSLCNLRCPLCHIVTDGKEHGLLEMEDFVRIIDEVGDRLLFLHFWGWGEPFMNGRAFDMIRYAKNRGIQIITSTNGHFFGDRENVDKLIDSNLDVLIVALDGADAATYKKYRHQGDFQAVLDGLNLLTRRKRERRAATPRINLRMLVTRENEQQVPEMHRLAAKLGVDLFTIKTLCSFDNATAYESLLPCSPEFRRFTYNDRGEPVRIENPCRKPWNHPTVYRDGLVVACDYHTGEELSFGNAFEGNDTGEGFKRVWFGPAFRAFRTRFGRGERQGTRCNDCSLNYADVDRCVSHAYEIGSTEPTGTPSEQSTPPARVAHRRSAGQRRNRMLADPSGGRKAAP